MRAAGLTYVDFKVRKQLASLLGVCGSFRET